jgi:geranylgeranyl pyrophosphate synthase
VNEISGPAQMLSDMHRYNSHILRSLFNNISFLNQAPEIAGIESPTLKVRTQIEINRNGIQLIIKTGKLIRLQLTLNQMRLIGSVNQRNETVIGNSVQRNKIATGGVNLVEVLHNYSLLTS